MYSTLRMQLQVDATVGERASWDVFYATPSATVGAFFQAAAELSPGADASATATAQLAALVELAGAVQVTSPPFDWGHDSRRAPLCGPGEWWKGVWAAQSRR